MVICITASSALLLTGCNLFNNGSSDEVVGIYGVSEYFYRDKDTVTHNYADKFDYIILVLNGGSTGKFIIKPVDKDEFSFDVTYSNTYGDANKPKKVTSVKITPFVYSSQILLSGNVTSGGTGTSLNFYPVREDIVYRRAVLTSVEKNGTKSIVSVVEKMELHKLYNKPTDARIEKAKQKQINTRDSRTNSTDDAEDSKS